MRRSNRRNNVRKKDYKKIVIAIIVAVIIVLGIIKITVEINRKPEIVLNGDIKETINIGEEFDDQGARATYNGKEIDVTKEGEVVNSVPGSYVIKYVADVGKKHVEVDRVVEVIDNIAPEINLKGENEIKLLKGEEYSESGYTATDNVDGDLTESVQIDNKVDINAEGSYEVIYTVSDNAGNTTSVIRKVNVEERKISTNPLKNGLPVLMYHFFYDKTDGKTKTSAIDNNYMEVTDFEAQMKYLSDENFYFPTWQEVEDYIDGKISLPEKSVVITIDDGDESFFTYALPIVEKYNVNVTEFVITSWYGWLCEKYPSKNVSYQSHSDGMHEGGANGKGVMLSWSYDKILDDLKTSSKTLGGANIFCYPFGQYNESSKKVLKDAGYKLAFTTKGGRVYKGSDKYALPRVRTSRTMSLASFKAMVN